MRVVHCKKEKFDVYIGRPSIWGNPFLLEKDGDRDEVIRKYRDWLRGLKKGYLDRERLCILENLMSLDGKVLGCWCKPLSCHGDVLIEIIEGVKAGKIVLSEVMKR